MELLEGGIYVELGGGHRGPFFLIMGIVQFVNRFSWGVWDFTGWNPFFFCVNFENLLIVPFVGGQFKFLLVFSFFFWKRDCGSIFQSCKPS